MAMHQDIERRDALDLLLRGQTRRHFFSRCGVGLGSIALASLLGKDSRSADTSFSAHRPGHFPARARSVIYLFGHRLVLDVDCRVAGRLQPPRPLTKFDGLLLLDLPE